MSELKIISPLLDHMIVEKERFTQDGRPYYTLRNEETNERYVLKTMSLPESDSRIRALILSGAYPDEQSVHEYYGKLAEDVKAELELGQKLASTGAFAGALSFQVVSKDSGVGYDIYILYPLNISLSDFLAKNAITGLRAINLGIDICEALSACREAGYLYQNLTPENIFLMPTGRFLIGGLGLTSTEYLQYASVPEEYIGVYSAPEMSDITACPNLTIDLYALGMVLYRIYNGNHGPFEDESTNAAMSDKLRLTGKPLPSPLYADYELAEIILKACAFKTEERYQNPDEMKQALKLYMQRNEVSDDLIVPPIVADLDPLPLIDEDTEIEPIRMTEVDELDEDFRQNFAPDLSGAGDDSVPLAPEAEQAPEAPATFPEEPVASVVVEDEAAQSQEIAQYDPDQMDFDSLIASVNEIVNQNYTEEASTDEEVPSEELPEEEASSLIEDSIVSEHDYVDDDTYSDEEAEESEKPQGNPKDQKKSKLMLWGIIGGSLLAIALLGYFLLSWYFVSVTELKTISTTPTQIILELVSDDDPEYFDVTCTDSLGNVFEGVRSGNQYCFSGLSEKTAYAISVEAAKYHGFSAAAPALTEITEEYTVISDVKFERLNNDGDIMLSFDHKGPVPSQWKLTYAKKDGSDPHSYRFDGESYQINGLELYETYIFTFEDVDGTFINGEKEIEYQVFPRITADNFSITNIDDHVVTLSWTCGDATPEKWAIVCSAEGMDSISKVTSETSISITVPDFSVKYTFYLSAQGMDAAEQIVLDANPVIISNLTAQPDEDGNIVVTWDTPVGEPDGQWRVAYRLKHGYYGADSTQSISSVSCDSTDENSVVLKGLPANAAYEITLMALDTKTNSYPSIYGTTAVEAVTGEALPFTEYQILPAAPYGDGYEADGLIALWLKPDKETWDFRDLLTPRRTVYKATEQIAFCIEIDSCDLSTAVADDTVQVTYAVRNAEGNVVAVDSREMKWDSVWYSRRHTGLVPTPMTQDVNGAAMVQTGDFLIEVYINGKLLAVKGFTIEA